VLDDLVAGIEKHIATSSEDYSRRLERRPAGIGCVPWLTDDRVVDALTQLQQCCVIVDKQQADYAAVRSLARYGRAFRSVPVIRVLIPCPSMHCERHMAWACNLSSRMPGDGHWPAPGQSGGADQLSDPLVGHSARNDPEVRFGVVEQPDVRLAYRLRAWLRWAWAMARCVSRMPNMTSLAMIFIIAMVSFTMPLMMATTMST
jgi:hypothetical protein